jgi:hypothetical protein
MELAEYYGGAYVPKPRKNPRVVQRKTQRPPTGYMICKKGLYPTQDLRWNQFKPTMAQCADGGFPYQNKVRARSERGKLTMAEIRAFRGNPINPVKRNPSRYAKHFRSMRKADLIAALIQAGHPIRGLKSLTKPVLVHMYETGAR